MSNPLTWRISGDAGDSCFALALMHALGGQHIIRCVDRPGITSPWTPRVPLIKALFEHQEYVESVEISEKEPDIDLVQFRRWHSSTTTLIAAQACEYNMQSEKPLSVNGAEPWMSIDSSNGFHGKIIIARSPRYNNPRFPWQQIVEHYRDRLIFVGLPVEHANFCASFGHVNHLKTATLMEVARAIMGAALFIGNQSSPHAIALALGADIISEVDGAQPDCIYPRDNVKYVCTGEVTLPDISGSGILFCPPVSDMPIAFNCALVPPGMWQYKGLPPCNHFAIQRSLVEKAESCSAAEAEKMLFRHNAERIPGFFFGTDDNPMNLYNVAMANAFPSKQIASQALLS